MGGMLAETGTGLECCDDGGQLVGAGVQGQGAFALLCLREVVIGLFPAVEYHKKLKNYIFYIITVRLATATRSLTRGTDLSSHYSSLCPPYSRDGMGVGCPQVVGWLIILGSSNIIIMATELNQQPQATQKQKKNSYASGYSVLDYASIRNLSQNAPIKGPVKMLPGLGIKSQGSFLRKQREEDETMIEQPRLLTTAKARIQELQEEAEAASDSSNSNLLGVSSFLNSREVTPSNPLAPHRRKPYPKNKLNSVTSELFDIQSNPEEEKGQPKFKSKDFRLLDVISGQSEAVYQHVFGKERSVNPKTILAWKDCLSHEDKSEIYLPFADSRPEIPYTSSRIYQLNEIEKGFKEIYGTGKNRSLTIGEEAMVLQAIEKYLRICSRDPLKMGRKDFDILEDVLRECKMGQLEELPMCMKQVEMHFKLMATKWRYSGALDHNDRILEAALVMGKNNFLDLNRQNPLTAFLLKHSNISDI